MRPDFPSPALAAHALQDYRSMRRSVSLSRMIAVDGDTLNAVNVGGVYMVLGPRKAPGGSTPPAVMRVQ